MACGSAYKLRHRTGRAGAGPRAPQTPDALVMAPTTHDSDWGDVCPLSSGSPANTFASESLT